SFNLSKASMPLPAGTDSWPNISRICSMTLRMIAESSTTNTFISRFLQAVVRGPSVADDREVAAVELECLGGAGRERALVAHHVARLRQDVPLPGVGGVEHYVAQEHHVEHAQVPERVEQVHALEAHELAHVVARHRDAAVAFEILLAQAQRQAAAHRDRVVAAGLGDRERVAADVGGEDVEAV